MRLADKPETAERSGVVNVKEAESDVAAASVSVVISPLKYNKAFGFGTITRVSIRMSFE